MKKILVIDDNFQHKETIEYLLKNEGDFQVLYAEEGAKGIQLAKTEHPDLVILDMLMPGVDGFTTYRNLKNDPACCDISIVLLTVLTKQEIEQEGIQEKDIAFYISKPFDPKEFVEKIRAVLKTAPRSVS